MTCDMTFDEFCKKYDFDQLDLDIALTQLEQYGSQQFYDPVWFEPYLVLLKEYGFYEET